MAHLIDCYVDTQINLFKKDSVMKSVLFPRVFPVVPVPEGIKQVSGRSNGYLHEAVV